MHAVSEKEVFVGGGGVSMFDPPVMWHTADGGAEWTNTTLPGGGSGIVMGIDISADGKTGFATSVNPVASTTSVWEYVQ